ncbi:MAG: cysteine--1-D-myo-inosityl 2-amino-2-deoxy-alpha-D-glucopyranoside ligase, partial [Actinomycetota bacterium]|nr:cysteine--1-D-myo-inosityl 2-amino-2-deoxy-alpha-D-glucopyranoside ligase [Actinomycetota bacterium]
RHYTHSAMIGLDGEKMSKSRGNLVFVSRLRAGGVDPMAIRLGLLSGHYRTDRTWTSKILDEGLARVARWRAAVTSASAPPSADLIARLRDHLADDLDTPKAIAAIDAWAARAGSGGDTGAPGEVRAAIDALLGIEL